MKIIHRPDLAIKLKELTTPNLLSLEQIFDDNGFSLRLVGGAPRDFLLGGNPRDIDLATDAMPDEMIYMANMAKVPVLINGIQHGTIRFRYPTGEVYEITSLGFEVSRIGKTLSVHHSDSWEVDARRRDYTIDTLSMDFDGTVYDYLGALADLNNKAVRLIGDPHIRLPKEPILVIRFFKLGAKFDRPHLDHRVLSFLNTHKDIIRQFNPLWQLGLNLIGMMQEGKDGQAMIDKIESMGLLTQDEINRAINIALSYVAAGSPPTAIPQVTTTSPPVTELLKITPKHLIKSFLI